MRYIVFLGGIYYTKEMLSWGERRKAIPLIAPCKDDLAPFYRALSIGDDPEKRSLL